MLFRSILGAPYDLRAALYLYTIAPAWLGSSTTAAYGIAKSIGAVLVCLTAVPTWFLGRALIGPRLALLPAVLVLAGSWMTSAALILTENLALPLTTASLAAMVGALRTPGSRWGWLALGLAALATWSRMQCVVLIPTLFMALTVRAAVAWPQSLERLRRDRWLTAATGGLTVIGATVALVDPGTLGAYSSVVGDFRPSLGHLLAAAGHQAIGLVVMTADRKSTRLNSSHIQKSRMPSSA